MRTVTRLHILIALVLCAHVSFALPVAEAPTEDTTHADGNSGSKTPGVINTAPVVAEPPDNGVENTGLSQTSSLAFESLAQLDEMIGLGLSSLALSLLDDEQSHLPPYSPDWYAFEHKRIILLGSSGRWQRLLDRSSELLANAIPNKQITELIRQWFVTQQVVAHLQLKQPDVALQKARALLWNAPQGADNSEANAVLRQLVVRAYLQLDDVDDAQKALQKYQQDYSGSTGADDEEWKLLQARVLLRTSRYSEVIELLKSSENNIARALSMLAAVREDPEKAYSTVKAVEQLLDDNETRAKQKKTADNEPPVMSKSEVWAFNYVLYERARLMNHPGLACIALEKMLSLGDYSTALGDGFEVGADDLWSLYETVGQATGNEHQLLVGDDASWIALAKDTETATPVRAAGLYSVLVLGAHDEQSRQMAHRSLVELLARKENGLEIISRLYLHSTRITALDTIPEDIRFRLVDYSLTSGQIDLAARLMLTLQEPPEDKNPFDWRMRKARVLVLEGNYAAGVDVLRRAISRIEKLDAAMLDQYLQVLFDLQAVEQHEQALALFGLIREEWLDDKYRRELYYWKAESNYALERFAQSAWQYLMSARVIDVTMTDPWSQSARFKAADALTRAKLYDDAYTMYDELLAMTASETRRTWIRQAMQQIQLLRNAEKTTRENAHET